MVQSFASVQSLGLGVEMLGAESSAFRASRVFRGLGFRA